MQNVQRWLQPSEIFQIGIMARSQLDALLRNQTLERVMLWFWHIVVNVLQNLFIAVRTGDLQHFRVDFTDLIDFRAQDKPVTITLPFSFNASPIASRDS